CFAARSVDGDASEVLLWPLGGLAYCDLPHTPRAHLVTAVGGPGVNLLLCVIAGGALAFAGLVPPLHPFEAPFKVEALKNWRTGEYATTAAAAARPGPEATAKVPEPLDTIRPAPPGPRLTAAAPSQVLEAWHAVAAKLFWVNWFL